MATPDTIKLYPPDYRLEMLAKDYEIMSEMMFDEYPTFSDLMKYIKKLEGKIHKSSASNTANTDEISKNENL